MKIKAKLMGAFLAGLFGVGVMTSASAAPIVLDFEGIGNTTAVNNFYNGGTDNSGRSGTNYGIGFSNTSLAIIDQDAGGTGNFANEPSPNTVLFFLSGGAATMNIAAGFDTGFSFFYSSDRNGFVNVYDGLNGTGNLLTTLTLSRNIGSCQGDPTGEYCNFTPIGVTFNGTARSIDFGGTADHIAFDQVTFGSAIAGDTTGSTPSDPSSNVPEPTTTALLGLGMMGFLVSRHKKAA
jgi:hypothetical protein